LAASCPPSAHRGASIYLADKHSVRSIAFGGGPGPRDDGFSAQGDPALTPESQPTYGAVQRRGSGYPLRCLDLKLSQEQVSMSEQQNVQIVQNAYTAFARGNIQTILDSLADDVEWALPGEGLIPQAGTYQKRDGVARFFQTLTQTTEFSNFEPREFIAQG